MVGVGGGLGEQGSRQRIIDISGPDELWPNGSFADGKADFTFVGFTQLEAALKGLATDLCASSVKITKEVDAIETGRSTISRSDWKFTGNV